MFHVVLIVLCGGVVKGSALPVAACVAGHPSVLGVLWVCVYLCASLGYALNLLLAEPANRKARAVSISLEWRALKGSQGVLDWAPAVGKEESPGLRVCWKWWSLSHPLTAFVPQPLLTFLGFQDAQHLLQNTGVVSFLPGSAGSYLGTGSYTQLLLHAQ